LHTPGFAGGVVGTDGGVVGTDGGVVGTDGGVVVGVGAGVPDGLLEGVPGGGSGGVVAFVFSSGVPEGTSALLPPHATTMNESANTDADASGRRERKRERKKESMMAPAKAEDAFGERAQAVIVPSLRIADFPRKQHPRATSVNARSRAHAGL
jgi:hypothetical protein